MDHFFSSQIFYVCKTLIFWLFRGYSPTFSFTLNTRTTPAVRLNDGLDYLATNKYELFGHHFAAIAGAGRLVSPVLAAQMGYLLGMMWILVGAILAGAVQDFMIVFISTRRDGRSLGGLMKSELGLVPGLTLL